MNHYAHPLRHASVMVVCAVALFASAVFISPRVDAQNVTAQSAAAQENVVRQIWGPSGGLGAAPKEWLFAQSSATLRDIGSHTASRLDYASLPGYDARRWSTLTTPWKARPGPGISNHFRKSFDLADYGIALGQVKEIRVSFLYDDAAVLYLNGQEVYRSMRGNIDPTYATYPPNADIPYNTEIANFNGREDYYTNIPNFNGDNDCAPAVCSGPYGKNPPAIDLGLLKNGENVFAATVWDNYRGTGDAAFDLAFEVVLNETVEPSPVVVNEIVASNDGSLKDASGKTPDWIELRNRTSQSVSLNGWVLQDDSTSWKFPNVAIPANGYLIVFADDSSTPIVNGELHASFKLSKEGDSLTLFDSQGIRRDATGSLPQQITDVSYGRYDNGDVYGYMTRTTPNGANAGRSTGLDPIIRPFPRRYFNVGETVDLSVDAFDPDGTALTYQMSPIVPGITINTSSGAITGTATRNGIYRSTISVRDRSNAVTSIPVEFKYFAAPRGGASLVLSEYNAVAPDREIAGDPDRIIGDVVGNGGDWFEFLVVEDNLDLRGWTIELWDRDRGSELLEQAAALTFTDSYDLAALPAGTIITISEEFPDDLSFNPSGGDWNLNFQSNDDLDGAYFTEESQESFNSTRDDQNVIIRNASGVLRSPLVGETEAWDAQIGGVSGTETMALCVTPTASAHVDPLADYRSSLSSSFGRANTCSYPDPADPTNTVQVTQRLSSLRRTATYGAGSGDANCTVDVNNTDTLAILEYAVGLRTVLRHCPIANRQSQLNISAADVNRDAVVTTLDALIIAQCTRLATANQYCPTLGY